MTFRDETRISLSSRQLSADLAGEAVVLNLENGVYFGLNPVGTRIWSLLKEAPRSVAELRQAILDEYDVEPGRCHADLLALLNSLDEHGLITISQ